MIFQLFGRPVHPELFEIQASRKIVRAGFELTCWLTRTGHVFKFENDEVLLTEVTASSDQPMPEQCCLSRHRIHNEFTRTFPCANGLEYQVGSQIEVLTPELYDLVHDEILDDGKKRGMLCHFPSESSLHREPLGYLTAASREDCIFLSSFHTFPSEFAVVKTQSLIERV